MNNDANIPGCPTCGEVATRIARWKERAEKAEAFKNWTHDYLDRVGIPTHPDGPHSKEGCRVGDRMDLLVARIAERDAKIAALDAADASVKKTLAEWIARAERAEEKLRLQEPIVKAAVHLDAVAEDIGDYSFFIDAAEAKPEVNVYWLAVNSVEDAITEWRDALARKELGGDHA